MKTFSMALVVSLLVSLAARADDIWRKPNAAEIVVHVATDSLLLVDMLETLDIKNHPGLPESNFIMGEHPSDGVVLGYFASVILIHTAVWYIAPPIARYFVDAPIVYFEAPIVVNNRTQWGLKLRLPF